MSYGSISQEAHECMAQALNHLGGNLFSAGDMRTGPSLVVRALSDGRAAAAQIDSWPKRLPRR